MARKKPHPSFLAHFEVQRVFFEGLYENIFVELFL